MRATPAAAIPLTDEPHEVREPQARADPGKNGLDSAAAPLERTLARTHRSLACLGALVVLFPRQASNVPRSPIRRRSVRCHPVVYGYPLRLNDAFWRRGLLPVKIESRRIPHPIGDSDVQFLSLR